MSCFNLINIFGSSLSADNSPKYSKKDFKKLKLTVNFLEKENVLSSKQIRFLQNCLIQQDERIQQIESVLEDNINKKVIDNNISNKDTAETNDLEIQKITELEKKLKDVIKQNKKLSIKNQKQEKKILKMEKQIQGINTLISKSQQNCIIF